MIKEIKEALSEQRNQLLREAKQEKSEEYKSGFIDGILDMFNKSIVTIDNHIKE